MTHTQCIAASLFFLLVFLSGCVCEVNVSVKQTPAVMTAAPGQHVNITCHFTIRTSASGRWKIMWWKNNNTTLQNNTKIMFEIKPNISSHVNESRSLLLPAVSVSDSGVYYCSVWQDVPQLGTKTSGGGTQLIVNSTFTIIITPTAPTAENSLMWKLLVSSLLVVVCVVFVSCCVIHRGFCMRRKKESQSEPSADTGVVYAAVKLYRGSERKNTQELGEAPDAGCAVNTEVLYSDIRIK
ncbi:uncharacterized protein si:dkey-63d15.12 [Tachysurus fulvidraco]|uniref:uncharacterized protein si:dkey-63d15.12 n=1 Tax=Tachysurus fulvidraco TaxID=1234273 RepID=UPI000F50BDC4|nr:uncharacterized protein si:dkey-63d15.12 [Tachysurus fulvidraco]